MLQAKVVGNMVPVNQADRRAAERTWIEVEVDWLGRAAASAFDVLGGGQGERVLVVQGSVAAGWLPGRPPIDALIVGSIGGGGGGLAQNALGMIETKGYVAGAGGRGRDGEGRQRGHSRPPGGGMGWWPSS